MPSITELKQKRAALVTQARGLTEKATTEKRDLTAEESQQFNRIMDVALGELDTEIKTAEAQDQRMNRLAQEEARLAESAGRRSDPNPLGTTTTSTGAAPRELRYKVNGRDRVVPLTGARASDAYASAFRRSLTQPLSHLSAEESRALQADSDIGGGFLAAPQAFAATLIQALDNIVFVRQVANVLPPLVRAESLGCPTRENDLADTDWTSEIATGSEDASLTFGKRELKPHPLAKRIKVSKKLLQTATIDPDAIVRDRLAYKFAVTQEKGFLTGSGANQPLGVFTASANGISTGRDVSTGNTTSAIAADGLIEAKYSIKSQYWKNLQWAFHRDAVKGIAKLKDGDGQYLWQMGLTAGVPDRLLGFPVNVSEYCPNTFTTGLYVGILGDWSQYQIVDSLSMTIQVLLELYAETNQNGYIGRLETDGQPVIEEAFARVKLA